MDWIQILVQLAQAAIVAAPVAYATRRAIWAHIDLVGTLKVATVQQTVTGAAIQKELASQTVLLSSLAEGKHYGGLEEYLHTRMHDLLNGQQLVVTRLAKLEAVVDKGAS